MIALTQQLHFRKRYFFRAAAFFSFFGTASFSQFIFQNSFFSERKFYRAATSWEQEVLYGSSFSKQLFFPVYDKKEYLKKELLFQGRYFYIVSTFSEKLNFGKSYFFRKTIFLITFFSWRAAFLERLPTQKRWYLLLPLPFEKRYFFTTYFFRRVSILQLRFFSTAVLLIYSLVKWTVLSCASIIAQSCIIDG